MLKKKKEAKTQEFPPHPPNTGKVRKKYLLLVASENWEMKLLATRNLVGKWVDVLP